MKIQGDPSQIEFNLTESKNVWNVPFIGENYKVGGSNGIEHADKFGIIPIINAVEIDWNGAQLDKDLEINTTGELLKVINDMLKKFKTTSGNVLQLAIYEEDPENPNNGTLVFN